MPTSVAYIGTGQIMGWGNKAIEVFNTFFLEQLHLQLMLLELVPTEKHKI